MNPTIKLVQGIDKTGDFKKLLKALTAKEVLVGVPEAKAPRKGGGPSNALLAYVHDNGSPTRGIPAREFLRSGIKAVQPEIAGRFEKMGRRALDGDAAEVDKGLNAVGLLAQKSVRRKISTGPFTPLKPATIRARRRRGRMGTKELIDTGQLRQAINYVIRNKK